jgi:hypothetical protein
MQWNGCEDSPTQQNGMATGYGVRLGAGQDPYDGWVIGAEAPSDPALYGCPNEGS